MVRWAISGTGPMAASAAPGAAFLRSDDERYVSPFCFPLVRFGRSIGEVEEMGANTKHIQDSV